MDREGFLVIEGLRKSYNGLEALRGVDVSLGKGEFLVLFGPNGAGKTTLIRTVAALLRPDAGSIRVRGFDMEENPGEFRAQLGVVSHHSLLYNGMSARENLLFYARLYGVENPGARAAELLELVGLAERGDQEVSGFSRGMQQRLSIARALVNDPALLLLDEPYSGLDQGALMHLDRHLRRLRSRHRTIVMVTHDIRRGLEVATKVGILSRGRLVYLEDRSGVDPRGFEDLYVQCLEGRRAA